jgi:hypothetical protein
VTLRGYDAWRTTEPDVSPARCCHCDDSTIDVGALNADNMCSRCALCWFCDAPATHYQEGTDRPHCPDCWEDVAHAARRRINEENAERRGDYLRDQQKDER